MPPASRAGRPRCEVRLRQIVLFAGLLGLAVLILAFAHAWDAVLPNAPRAKCFETFWSAQWPKWIGCAMAAHSALYLAAADKRWRLARNPLNDGAASGC